MAGLVSPKSDVCVHGNVTSVKKFPTAIIMAAIVIPRDLRRSQIARPVTELRLSLTTPTPTPPALLLSGAAWLSERRDINSGSISTRPGNRIFADREPGEFSLQKTIAQRQTDFGTDWQNGPTCLPPESLQSR